MTLTIEINDSCSCCHKLKSQLLATMQREKELDDALASSADWSAQLKDDLERAEQREARLREALKHILDIEKPMLGEQPETNWLSWYTTSSQQTEIAADALAVNQDIPNE